MMRRIWNHITLAFLQLALSATIGFTSCSQGKAEKNLRSAYYWSTTWQLDSNKMNFIQKHHINRIYVRYFDVVKDADGEIMPNATLHFNTFEENRNGKTHESLIPEGIEIIPVVYIVNDCLKTNEKMGKYLADKILLRILQMNEANDASKGDSDRLRLDGINPKSLLRFPRKTKSESQSQENKAVCYHTVTPALDDSTPCG